MADPAPDVVRTCLAQALLARTPELTGDLTGRMLDVLQNSGPTDAGLRRAVAQLAQSVIVESMNALPTLEPGPQGRTLSAAIVLARRLAEIGVNAHRTDQIFHVAQAWWLDEILAELARLQPCVSMDVVAPLMRWQLRGFLGLSDAAGQEHAAVLDAWQEAWDRALGARVSFVLADVENAAEAEAVLHYSFTPRHVGLVLWSGSGRARVSELRSVVADLGVAHGVIDTLVVPRDISTLFVWLSLSGSAGQVVAAIDRRTAGLPDVRTALGEPLRGLPGFKKTHEQALLARSMAHLPGSRRWRLVQYRDVAPSSMVIKHPEDIEPWVSAILGELGGPGEDAERLRDTLRVYLESGENATRAAGRLYVHRNTVKFRVARAMELLAVPLEQHRLSVALALNYHHVAIGFESVGPNGSAIPDNPVPDG